MNTKPKGLPKTGGRKKGSQNKVLQPFRTWLQDILDNNRDTIKTDLTYLEPKERLAILEKFMAYCYPKPQSVSVEMLTKAETDALAELLRNAPEEAINKIAQKVVEIQGAKAMHNE